MRKKLLRLTENRDELKHLLKGDEPNWFNIVFLEHTTNKSGRYAVFFERPDVPLNEIDAFIDDRIDHHNRIVDDDSLTIMDYNAVLKLSEHSAI